MRVLLHCPNQECRRVIRLSAGDAAEQPGACPSCATAFSVQLPAAPFSGPINRCLSCGCEDLFIRKDFPQRLGLALVVLAGLASCVFFAYGRLLWALGILAGMVLLDWLIYLFVGKLTVCYRCRAEFRDIPLNPDHEGFDLATAEKFRGHPPTA